MRSEPTDRIDSRLTDLEVKAAFTEDLIDRLNDVIVRQQDQIDRLICELARLRLQGPSGEPPAFRSLREELPPHY
jgi:SlyX protein